MNLFLLCVIGYFVGSIPTGFLLTKFSCGMDIRNFGSHSTGATNVLRTGNKKLAFLTLLIDALKVIDDEEVEMFMVNPKAPCFIKDANETYIYLILPVNFTVA